MLFAGDENREEILDLIQRDPAVFDNLIAMANVGAAFTSIAVLEDLVGVLILTSKAELKAKLNAEAIEASDLFLERYNIIKNSTLGRLMTVIEQSGVSGREIRYLRAIVELRNNFVHRLMEQVPLPGDWHRYGYTIEAFSRYTRYVIRHTNVATARISRIMQKYGLLAGKFGDYGALLWNPDDPVFGSRLDEE